MSAEARQAFARQAKEAFSGLLLAAAEALRVEVRLLDLRGEVIAGSGATDRGVAAPRLRAPIEHRGVTLGQLEAIPGCPAHEPLLRALAEQIAARFGGEQDLDRIADRLGQAYDEINLLYRFTRIQQPDRSLAENTVDLLAETAEMITPRLLILGRADGQPLQWHCPLATDRPQALRWLVHAPENLAAVQAEFARRALRPEGPGERCPGALLTPHGMIDYLLVPVRTRAETSGFVGLFRADQEAPLETGEVRLLECLAKELSHGATYHRLLEELNEMLFSTVRGLVAAIDAKDEYTRGHSQRVYHISLLIAERLGLPAEELQAVSWAALLHDVGKIAIDRAILNKPGRLTDDEYRMIQTHPARGCRVLEPIPQLRGILPGIRHHHERWDGRGYPDGLQGEAIPLVARIIGVADTYDAIVSTRAYRQAGTLDHALAEIERGLGTQFDPRIVPVFLELAAEGALAALTPEAEGNQAAA
ncbi:MAG: HD-GYP domain-containing protein [Candidatus Eisenbacteria bacterium]|uniref:HD-GYP domain-containing protein n=1 Tax=Eiseniibacteriota bacterium TaxID=2212470 RepID=A0A938BPU3_UNCEI|nr:HD-GYP domain-containing protein [Candidatus Eisenbacteria bacterium]